MNAVDTLFRLIDRGRKGENIGLGTGIPKLDKCTGGIQKGIYTLLFAGSGNGKSSLALYSYIYRPLRDNPDKNIKIIYHSLEMSETILLSKLLCMYVYEEYGKVIPYSDLLSWNESLDDESYEILLKGKDWLKGIQADKLIIFDRSLNAARFYSSTLKLLSEWGETIDDGRKKTYIKHDPNQIVLVVVDHLALCTPTEGRKKKEEMDLISSYAVTLRERCGVSFLILMQENRNSADMDRRKAEMSEPSAEDLKDTGNPYNDSWQKEKLLPYLYISKILFIFVL